MMSPQKPLLTSWQRTDVTIWKSEMKKLVTAVLATMLLASCVSQPEPEAAEASNVERLAALMIDTFETAPDDPDNDIRDQRVLINSPSLEGTWIYYQLNTGPERKVYRQRIIELIARDDGAVIQKTYGLKSPEEYVAAWDNAEKLNALSQDDFEPYFDDGCEQIWRLDDTSGWIGYVDPATCKIFSERRQANISIEAEARLNEEAYRQTERGFDEDGNKLFGTKPGEFIVLYRQ